MIKLSEEELRTVKNILKTYASNLEILVFGSRVTGKTHEHSDLDIALKGKDKLDLLLLANLKDDFQDSDLSFRVDIVDYHRISPEFQKVILKKYVLLNV
ncbi:nucleotidyltransferase domain-containing protein [Heliorestis acidaminivorans]|uniref:Nucleotidyltransferase domain-containing protein n=1 Tax=Heliorestis acidaminivorans TaxID=553427 RepID=A0A6I0EVL9_9FIRM|nr:nucleotidyltransferase domain-containing protein [Heliorestis acidaminivorans]KAB2951968.1 nucleotidyltransferase domain-containing protein [Heliorestis acidaminivorans]